MKRDTNTTLSQGARSVSVCLFFVACALLVLALFVPPLSYADSLSSAKADLAEAKATLTQLQSDQKVLEESITALQGEIDAIVPEIMKVQTEYQETKRSFEDMIVFRYKVEGVPLYEAILSSKTFADVLQNIEYLEVIESSLGKLTELQKNQEEALDAKMKQLDTKKTEQTTAQHDLAAKETEAKKLVEDTNARVDDAENALKHKAPAAGAGFGGSLNTGGVIDDSWQLGMASAYSFADNDGWDATASGIPLDWTSFTVAVPISQRYLLGRSVEVSYNGTSLVALVTDVGGFAGYGRVLDFAPGIWRAFGASNPGDWGVRQVAYRYL